MRSVARLAGEVVAQHVGPSVGAARRLADDQQAAGRQDRSGGGNDIGRRTEAAGDDGVDRFVERGRGSARASAVITVARRPRSRRLTRRWR